MSLEKVLSITGKPGLYKLRAQSRNGFIAESLIDGRKISVNFRHDISVLSEIAIYTYSDEVPLPEVFEKIYEKENGKKSISHKESKAKLKGYFEEILPEYDEDRVYGSDIKKVFQWYNILVKQGYTSFTESKEEKEATDEEE